MKLLTYEHNYVTKLGALVNDKIVDLSTNGGPDFPKTMVDLIAKGDAGLEMAQKVLDSADASALGLDDVTLMPPIIRSPKVLALGKNYAAHAAEGGTPPPDYPMLFFKSHTSLNGHNRSITIPAGAERVDYEAEMAVIIGKKCKNVSEDEAMDYVFGYACANDVCERAWQRRTSQFASGKMVDEFGPLGPYIATKDEIDDVQNLDIKLWHNGNLMQSSNTKMMIFSVAFTIAYTSKILTLEPGDVIFTGTPEGVGYARKPPVYMKAGDELVVEITGLGQLKNHFVG